jgi:hypothetical protein
MLVVLVALWRGRLAPPWPLVLCTVGILVNALVGTMVATLAADVLLLAAAGWVAVTLARLPRDTWLMNARTSPQPASPRPLTGRSTTEAEV